MKRIKTKFIICLFIVSLFSLNGFAAKKPSSDGTEVTAKEKPAKKTKEEKQAEKEAKKAEKEALKQEKAAAKEAAKEAKKAEKAEKAGKEVKEPEKKAEELPVAEEVVADETESTENPVEISVEEMVEEDRDPDLDVLDRKGNKKAKREGKNYIGWLDTSGRNINMTYGNINFKAKPRLGTFNISVINEDGKTIPAFSTANEYTTTSFYLKAGKKLIKLNDDSGVKSAARKIADGIQIGYRIDNVADVVITFNCLSSVQNENYDTVKISSQIYNRGKKKQEMAIKFVFDTVFGETDRHHFYDQEGKPVKNEISLRSFEDEKWYVSKNSKAAMQIIFVGGECTTPELVALANYSTLDTVKWEPEMISYRAFDTVLSYNNSAAGIIWPSRKVAVDDFKKEVFYLSFATDGKMPIMGELLNTPPEPEPEEELPVEEEVVEGETEEPVPEETEPAPVEEAEPEVIQAVVVPAVPEVPVVTKPVSKERGTETIPAVEESGKESKSKKTEEKAPEKKKETEVKQSQPQAPAVDKFSPEYIQSLLNRIEALSDSGDPTAKEELLRLNSELDEILGALQNL